MSSRQKFWGTMLLTACVVGVGGWLIGVHFGSAGTPLSILFGFAVGAGVGATIPLDWTP